MNIAIHSLQGALGKTAGRSYKAAPRQLLQVDTNGSTDIPGAHGHISKEDVKKDAAGAAKEAAKRGRETLGVNPDVGCSLSLPFLHLPSFCFIGCWYSTQRSTHEA